MPSCAGHEPIRRLVHLWSAWGTGLFVPKPSNDADCQGCGLPDLGIIVHRCLLSSVAGDGDCYSLGYSVAHAWSDDLLIMHTRPPPTPNDQAENLCLARRSPEPVDVWSAFRKRSLPRSVNTWRTMSPPSQGRSCLPWLAVDHFAAATSTGCQAGRTRFGLSAWMACTFMTYGTRGTTSRQAAGPG